MNEEPPAMSVTEAIQLLGTVEPSRLTSEQAAGLHRVLERNPGLHVMAGGLEAVARYHAALEKRLFSPPAVTSPEEVPQPSRKKRKTLFAVAAGVMLAGGGVLILQPWKNLAGKDSAGNAASAGKSATAVPVPENLTRSSASTVVNTSPQVPPPRDEAPRFEVDHGEARLEPDGKGGYRLSGLDGATRVKLSGRIKHLQLEGTDGRAELDATGLIVDRIDFRGAVDGTSIVKLNAPGGTIEFHRGVGGATKLQINAPGGKVLFHGNNAAKVAGGTQLKIIAQSVDFATGMEGGSKADITLTDHGTLRCVSLSGGAKLTYRKSAPGDSTPAVAKCDLREGGRLIPE